ncbi:AI-2E family transporter [Myxococcus sp. RHSTA-1-4]|uniref:AI-2E family transporter n=1 Tax=Myxococcus sp. RHSTA-1-4 TaxID=2874601 RepID=UPI001CBF6110|nr:AI-2E family transporter [Myxococcus sp. RHSTA-1-4]
MSWARPTLEGLARFSGQCLLVAAFLYVVAYVVRSVPLVFLSLFVALLLTTLLQAPAEWLARHRFPRSLAALVPLVLGLGLVGGLLAFIIPRMVDRISAHADMLAQRAQDLATSLTRLLPGEQAALDALGAQAERWVRENAQALAMGAASGLTALVSVVSGVLLVLVLTFFFVRDGGRMLRATFSLLPPRRRRLASAASSRAWRTLSQWVRGTLLVALADAVGIGAGLLLLGIPLALPLALLVFLGAFVPVIGALVTGVLAVLVAWATVGTREALFTLGIVLAVQQLEGNVLQPLVMGRVLPLHPAVLLLAVTAGALAGGIAGAFVSVPLLAMVTAGTQAFLAEGRKLRTRERERPEERGGPDAGVPLEH